MKEFDVCVIGSGAGGGPIAYELSRAGFHVAVMEKGGWYTEKDFTKDEIACRRDVYTPNLRDEFHQIEDTNSEGHWATESSAENGFSFWNGNCVGGSSNFMSGYFLRMKPVDFRLLSEFGPIEGANIADWPIGYEELEPYYTKVESVVGISGRVVKHPNLEPRSTPDFPFPPLGENVAAKLIDKAALGLGYHSFPVSRAILSRPINGRNSCYYSNYCGSYGCSSGAKGSSRAALLNDAVATGNCSIFPESQVFKLVTDQADRVSHILYFDREGKEQRLSARIFVVACQAIETARLLLLSQNSLHPNGLGNRYGQLGKNLLFSGGGSGGGSFNLPKLAPQLAKQLRIPGLFINRALQDWYVIEDEKLGRVKGGTIDFVLEHANPIRRANSIKWEGSRLLFGGELKQALKRGFTEIVDLRFEVFNDWLPNDNCFVSLGDEKDKWGKSVAKVRIGAHPHDLQVGEFLGDKAKQLLDKVGVDDVYGAASSTPPTNLMAGGCRFGDDPETSFLTKECRAHLVSNLYVTDGSFMPTGGSVPYTWTIYANSFRVADFIKTQL